MSKQPRGALECLLQVTVYGGFEQVGIPSPLMVYFLVLGILQFHLQLVSDTNTR